MLGVARLCFNRGRQVKTVTLTTLPGVLLPVLMRQATPQWHCIRMAIAYYCRAPKTRRLPLLCTALGTLRGDGDPAPWVLPRIALYGVRDAHRLNRWSKMDF